MANSVRGVHKSTRNINQTTTPGVWYGDQGMGFSRPDLSGNFDIEVELVKNPNDGAEVVLASASIKKEADWTDVNANEYSATMLAGISTGTEADNGSTPTQIKWVLDNTDYAAGNVYAVRIKLVGHSDGGMNISGLGRAISVQPNSSGQYQYEQFLAPSPE